MEKIRKALSNDPKYLGYNQILWDGKLLSHHISIHFGILLSVHQCQGLIRKLGFRPSPPENL